MFQFFRKASAGYLKKSPYDSARGTDTQGAANNEPIQDLYLTPVELSALMGPTLQASKIAGQIYIRRPNVDDMRSYVNDYAIPFDYYGHVAKQFHPPPNVSQESPAGVKMSVLLRQLEQHVAQVQDYLLGAP